jgi:mannose-6-phosphate isomerase-like protein (cupin superfamily)
MQPALSLAESALRAPGLVVVEWTHPGGGSTPPAYIAPLHRHFADDEAWYVLEGALAFRVGEEELVAEAGAGVAAPRGVAHTYWNPRPEPARYLLAMGPTIDALLRALHEPGRPDDLAELFAAHSSEFLGWP